MGQQTRDLADAATVQPLLPGVDAVVHMGGVAVKGTFEPILQTNIRGVHNPWRCG